jgi:hypothetical protein
MGSSARVIVTFQVKYPLQEGPWTNMPNTCHKVVIGQMNIDIFADKELRETLSN